MAFVGRGPELARLASAIRRASEGGHGRVLLTGPGGVGISTLLDEVVRRIATVPGITVARGIALEPCAGEPYQALADALGDAFGALTDDRIGEVVGRAGHDLAGLLPDLAPRLAALGVDLEPPRLAAPDQLGSRVQEAILGALERLARPGIVLLVLEDLHHADPATRGLLRAILRIDRPLPLCLLLSLQPDELHRRHPARELATTIASDPTVEVLAVGPLGADAIEQLVRARQADPFPGDLLAAVVEGSGGNPLIATQLVAAEQTLAGVRLSDPFDQVTAARLDAMAPSPRRLVRLLAAARQPMARRQALSLPLPDGRVTVSGVGEAIDGGMVVERDGILAIAHAWYAEAIDDHELPPERASIHATLAAALADRPARAAWHWERAARLREARQAHLRAATAAERLDPGQSTLLHLQRALELGGAAGADGDDLRDLLRRAARAAAAEGAFRRAATLMRRAIENPLARAGAGAAGARGPTGAGRDDGERLVVGAMVEEIGRFEWAAGDLTGGVRSMEQALSVMPPGASPERARALAALAQHLMLDGRFGESAALAEEARRTALAAGEAALAELGHATCTLGVDVAYAGEVDRGLALLEEADAIARRLGRLADLMRAAANRTTLLDLDGRREDALGIVADGIREAEAGGLSGTYGAFLRGNAAETLYHLGRWTEAELECRAGMEWQPAGVAWFSPTLYLGLVLVESRADEEAASLVGRTLLQLDTVPAGQWSALVQRAAVSLALWRGDVGDAVRVAARAWPRVLETGEAVQVALGASTCLEAAAAAVERGRSGRDVGLVSAGTELADRVLPEAAARVTRRALPPFVAARREAELHLEMARAHRARIRGRPSADAWDAIATGWIERRVPYLAAKARWWQALALLSGSGVRTGAGSALESAWRMAAELPARPLLGALADLGARARLALPVTDERLAQLVAIPVHGRPRQAVGPGRPPEGRPGTFATDGFPGATDGLDRGEAAMGSGHDGLEAALADRFRPVSPSHAAGLSPREMDVLRSIAEGRTDREIAERLFISERTVHVHVRHVLAKLGVSSRTQAAAVALREGLVPLGGRPLRG